MGQRTFLSKSNKDTWEHLFEFNNDIPFFWYCLMDITSVEKAEPGIAKWITSLNTEYAEDRDGNEAVLHLEKETFICNANEARSYINERLTERLSLYDDFISYLDTKFTNEDVLELDIKFIAEFQGVDALIQNLKDTITGIKTSNVKRKHVDITDGVYSLTGYDMFFDDVFRDYSRDYAIFRKEDDEKRKIAQELARKKKARARIGYILKDITFMLVIGAVFTFGGILMIVKEGVGFLPVATLIFGVACVGYGIVKIFGLPRQSQ
jgi:hypothetical protein